MKLVAKCLLLALCIGLPIYGQSVTADNVQYAGCYEVRTLTANPPDYSTRLLPSRFQLSTDRSHLSSLSFVLKPLGESVDPHSLQLFSWTPKQNRLHVAFSNGKWGYYGKLKPAGADEFTGNLKYFCDWRGHCGKHAIGITVHKMACP